MHQAADSVYHQFDDYRLVVVVLYIAVFCCYFLFLCYFMRISVFMRTKPNSHRGCQIGKKVPVVLLLAVVCSLKLGFGYVYFRTTFFKH